MRFYFPLLLILSIACRPKNSEQTAESTLTHTALDSALLSENEMKYLRNIKQLTFGGNNAEAYWSFDDEMLVFQSDYSGWGAECDQIFYTNWKTDDLKNNMPQRLSTGLGRTTCSYFLPGNQSIVYASTHLGGDDCPPVPERRADGKYVWPIYDSYDIFTADMEGNILEQSPMILAMTERPRYLPKVTKSYSLPCEPVIWSFSLWILMGQMSSKLPLIWDMMEELFSHLTAASLYGVLLAHKQRKKKPNILSFWLKVS